MLHARFLEAYIHFALSYMTDHIFPVLPIKDLINEDNDLTTQFKPTKRMKPPLSHLPVLFCPCVVRKASAHVKKGVKYASPSAKGFPRYVCWNSTAPKKGIF